MRMEHSIAATESSIDQLKVRLGTLDEDVLGAEMNENSISLE